MCCVSVSHSIEMHSRSAVDCSALIKIENDIKITKDSMMSLFFRRRLRHHRRSLPIHHQYTSIYIVLDAVILYLHPFDPCATQKNYKEKREFSMISLSNNEQCSFRACGYFILYFCFIFVNIHFIFIATHHKQFGNGFVAFVFIVVGAFFTVFRKPWQ